MNKMTRMKRQITLSLTIAMAAVLLLSTRSAVTAQVQDKAAAAGLKAAMDKETLEGDPKSAIEQYKKIAESKDRAIAAQALVRMAESYRKLGDTESRRIYERIVKDFGDQTEAATLARARLDGAPVLGTLTKRLLHNGCAGLAGDLSSDGRFVVDGDFLDTGDLIICNTSTGQRERLFVKSDSELNAHALTPEMSPDLRQIVYNWDTGERTKPNSQLRIVAREPRSKSQLVLDSPEYPWFAVDAWFPDGKSVLVRAQKRDGTWELLRVAIGSSQITHLKSLEWRLSGALYRDPWGGRARVSPDGRYIAYSALAINPKTPVIARPADSDQHIYVLATDGSGEAEAVKTAGVNASPIWTRDGSRLLFTSDRSGSVGLWSVVILNGRPIGSEALIVPEIGKIIPIAMRGNSYFYQEPVEQLESIAIVDAKHGAVARTDRPSPRETFAGLAPSWSPDGKWIAFKRRLPKGQDQNVLVVRSVETGEETMYPTSLGATGAGLPATWYHDSKNLLLGVNGDFYRVDLKTREFHPLGIKTQAHALSPDDKTLYVVKRAVPRTNVDATIVAVDLATGAERLVSGSPRGTGNSAGTPDGPLAVNSPLAITLSPDGRTLAVGWLQDPIGQTQLHIGRISLESGSFRELYTYKLEQREWNGILRWTRDGKSILFNQGQAGGFDHWGIMQIPADGGASASLVLESSPLTGFDLSGDGSRLVVGDIKQGAHLVALDNVLSLMK